VLVLPEVLRRRLLVRRVLRLRHDCLLLLLLLLKLLRCHVGLLLLLLLVLLLLQLLLLLLLLLHIPQLHLLQLLHVLFVGHSLFVLGRLQCMHLSFQIMNLSLKSRGRRHGCRRRHGCLRHGYRCRLVQRCPCPGQPGT
jgi:hypothetical protein